MFGRLFSFVLFLVVLSVYSNSSLIDFSERECIDPFNAKYSKQIWGNAFNYAPELVSFFYDLQNKYKISTVVETGTEQGRTTKCFSLLFDQVYTIELNEAVYQKTKKNLEPFANIHCHLGSSELILEKLLPSLSNQPVLFYLDAHWNSFWPLRDELEMISRTHKDNCIVVIDDVKVPDRPDFPYDTYKRHECSLAYVQDKLSKIYSEYDCFYLLPKNVSSRAKLVVIPRLWNFQP